MGQVIENTIRLIIDYAEKGQRFPLTVNELQQLAYLARRQLTSPAKVTPYPTGDVAGPCVCGSWPGGACLKCPELPAKVGGDERQAFERWYEGAAMPAEADWFKREADDPNEYAHADTESAWQGWQARAALSADGGEGCTPADAKMLRFANHSLERVVDEYRIALGELVDQIEKFAEEHGEADFETGRALRLLNGLLLPEKVSADGGDRKDALTDGEFRDLVNKVTNTAKVFGQTQQLRERIRDDLECVRPCSTDDMLCAERYRTLRDVPTELLNTPGIPCIAVPFIGNKGTMYNGADADRVVDARIAANQARKGE